MQVNGKEIDVKQYRSDWALALMSQGIIVKLTISRWRATASLSKEDLGIKTISDESEEFIRKYISLGRESLFPPAILSEIHRIEVRARSNLEAFSFQTVWGKFIPYTAFSSWEKENELIKKDYMDAARALWERHDEILAMVRKDYRDMAKDVWARLYPDQGEATDSFIENFISNVIKKIPDKTDILASFKYEETFLIIPMPSLLEENLSKAQQIRQEREIKIVENEIQIETKRRVAEEYIRRKQELVDGFLESTVASLRKYVGELCDTVLESLSKDNANKDVPKLKRDKIKRVIKRINLLNFYNDKEVSKLLGELEMEVDKFKGERDKNLVINKLQEISNVVKQDFTPTDFNPTIGYLEI